jgi:Fe-S oxidoreductase
MQMTRDRLHDYGAGIQKNGTWKDDGKTLHDYITPEELWACNTCNACHDACPVNINPMDIIVQMRQYKVMEQSAAPEPLNAMFTNTENNQAPWAFPAADRFNWAHDLAITGPAAKKAELE